MDKIKLPCIVCPVGCNLEISIENNKIIKIEGYKCKRGIKYAETEIYNPVRTVTSTIKVKNGIHCVCPVRTDGEIPKNLIFECMKEINKISIDAPIKIDQIIIENILNTNINLIATRDLDKSE